ATHLRACHPEQSAAESKDLQLFFRPQLTRSDPLATICPEQFYADRSGRFDVLTVHSISCTQSDKEGEAVIRIVSAKILPLYFAVACSVCVSAQDSPLDRNLKDRCVSWVRSVTPNKRVDPVDFCSGVIRDNVNGWSSISSCGIQPPRGASKP